MKWLFTVLFFNSTLYNSKIDITNACLDTSDINIWNTSGKVNFKDYMNTCGKQCIGNNDCTVKCVQKEEGYGDQCAKCFGNLGECSVKNCFTSCIGGDSPSCEKCISNNCDNDFKNCSGLDLPPPSYLRGSL